MHAAHAMVFTSPQTAEAMRKLTRVLGFASESDIADRLHDLAHAGRVEYLTI